MATRYQPETAFEQGNRFHGKTVAITGPSLHGIGGSIAIRFAEEGAALVLLGLQKPGELLDRLEALGCTADYFACDVTDAGSKSPGRGRCSCPCAYSDGRALCGKCDGGRLGNDSEMSSTRYRAPRRCGCRRCFFGLRGGTLDLRRHAADGLDTTLAHATHAK